MNERLVGFQTRLVRARSLEIPTAGVITRYLTYNFLAAESPIATFVRSQRGRLVSRSYDRLFWSFPDASGFPFNRFGGWNAANVAPTGDGFGNPPDLMNVNYLLLSVRR